MEINKTAFKRIFNKPKVTNEFYAVYFDKCCIIGDKHVASGCVAEQVELDDQDTIDNWMFKNYNLAGVYKISDSGVLISDAKGNLHRVYTAFTKEGYEHYIIKERYYPLIKGRKCSLLPDSEIITSEEEGDEIYIKCKSIDPSVIIKRQLISSLIMETTPPLFFSYGGGE